MLVDSHMLSELEQMPIVPFYFSFVSFYEKYDKIIKIEVFKFWKFFYFSIFRNHILEFFLLMSKDERRIFRVSILISAQRFFCII